MKKTSRALIFLSVLLAFSIITGLYTTWLYQPRKEITSSPKKAFHAVIFDLDGTTIDTDPLWKQAGFCVLCDYVPNLDDTCKQQLCNECNDLGVYETVTKIIAYLKENYGIQLSADQIFQECMPHLRQIYQEQGIEFIPHFQNFHQKVRDAKLKTAIATSSQQHLIELISSILPLQDYFDEHIYHADHVNRQYKPLPDVYLHAAQQLDVAPQLCIAIEDSSTGIKAAKAAGMYCIAINTANNKNALVLADEIVESFNDIDLEKLLAR